MSELRRPIESGVPDSKQFMPPALVRNYGKWAWHDRPQPGVLRHVSESGEAVYTVKAGTQRQLDVFTIRTLCDIADKFCDGHLRFTIRSSVEFMTTDQTKVKPLIEAIEAAGFPVGCTGNSVAFISHTQGWLH
jgi:sulfite reductase beta subunit